MWGGGRAEKKKREGRRGRRRTRRGLRRVKVEAAEGGGSEWKVRRREGEGMDSECPRGEEQ